MHRLRSFICQAPPSIWGTTVDAFPHAISFGQRAKRILRHLVSTVLQLSRQIPLVARVPAELRWQFVPARWFYSSCARTNERTNDGIQLHSPVRTPISTASLRTGLDWTSTMLLLLLLNSVCSGRTNLIRLVSAAASSVLPFGLCERMYERCRCLALSAAASSWSRSSIVVLLGSAK